MRCPFKKLVLFCGLSLAALSGQAQYELPPAYYHLIHRNYIGISLTELAFTDFRISYERRLTHSHGYLISAGYKLPFRTFTDATQIDLGLKATGWCYRNTANWLYVSAGYKYYFNRKKTAYLSPELFYKNMWCDRVVYTFGVGNGGSTLTNQYEIRSMSANLAGINLLIGKKLLIEFSNTFNMGFDVYTGLTMRYKLINTTIYGTKTASRGHDESVHVISIPLSEDPELVRDNLFQFSVQFGINLFCSWL